MTGGSRRLRVKRRLAYQPALDGLRALAVIAVLFFHGEVGAPGGFLGVSVFFTLSGYLITSIILKEHRSTGTIVMRDFYARRLRRLLPAALLCLAFVLALGGFWVATQRRELTGDALAALLDVANWRFALSTTSYQELFIGAPSPVAHFWSLSIEEQFYFVLPVVALLSLRHGRRAFAIVTLVLFAGSVAATFLTSDRDLIYNGTHTRAAELLFGVLLAQLPLRKRWPRRILPLTGVVALGGLVALVMTTRITDAWLYRGGLLGVGALSFVVIGAVACGRGPLVVVLSRPTLVAIGRVSYGLYLFHWPVFLVLNEARTGVSGLPLFSLRVGAALTAALISFVLVEHPIRVRHRLRTPRRGVVGAGLALTGVAIVAVVAVPNARFTATEDLLALADDEVIVFEAPAADDSGPQDEPVVVEPVAETTDAPTSVDDVIPAAEEATEDVVGPAPKTPVLVVGSDDSPVDLLGDAGFEVVNGVQRGCPVATAIEVKLQDGTIAPTSSCERSAERWARLLEDHDPRYVVVSTGVLDHGMIRRSSDESFPETLTEEAERADAAERDLREAVSVISGAGHDLWIVDHDDDGRESVFDDHLARLALTDDRVRVVASTDFELLARIDADLGDDQVEGTTSGDPLRVMVVGDSISLNFARALTDAAPGRIDVVWAGQHGCPFARVTHMWISMGQDWQANSCDPFDTKLPPLLDEFTPDVVLLMVSLRELVDQKYPGDDAAHAPGGPGYTAFHDAEMAALMEILDARGIPLLVADSPPIGEGPMSTPEMREPSRLDAWNAQVQRWADSSTAIEVFAYAAPLLDEEERNGSMRADGVHPELGRLTALARAVYVPDLLEQAQRLQALRRVGA